VNDVFSTKSCSSSYVAAALGAVQDRICKMSKQNDKNVLSIQHFLSCSKNNKSTKNCAEGSVSDVFDYLKKEGIVSESCYPY